MATALPPGLLQQLLAGAKQSAKQAVEERLDGGPSKPPLPPLFLLEKAAVGCSGGIPLPSVLQTVLDAVVAAAQAAFTSGVLTRRALRDLVAFELPNQTNRLALIFDPLASDPVPFVFGIEIFDRGHRTRPHVHTSAHELFFILSGSGEGFCGGERFPLRPGDVVAFRPGTLHGIDNGQESKMYCLEVMLPNEEFAEFVRAGRDTGGISDEDLCVIAPLGCAGEPVQEAVKGGMMEEI
jgi:hypothetical protein